MFVFPLNFLNSLAAISTLYFVEHNKQNDWHSREFFLEGNALVNSSYGGNGIPGSGSGGGGRFNNGNYWSDNNRYISKKVHFEKHKC